MNLRQRSFTDNNLTEAGSSVAVPILNVGDFFVNACISGLFQKKYAVVQHRFPYDSLNPFIRCGKIKLFGYLGDGISVPGQMADGTVACYFKCEIG